MTTKVVLTASSSGFAEDKEAAKEIRVSKILPSLERGERVILDFDKVSYATQSFIHALIGEPLKKYQEGALEKIEFRNCSPQLKGLVSLVVDYSLGGFGEEPNPSKAGRSKRVHK